MNFDWSKWILPILTFLFGIFLQRVLEWRKVRLGEKRNQREGTKERFDFRDKIEDKLAKLINLENDIHNEKDPKAKNKILGQFDLLKDDLIEIENNLSKLEAREPRDIFRRLRPEPPTGIKVILE